MQPFNPATDEVVIGNPDDPDVIVRKVNGRLEVHPRPGLRKTIRTQTAEAPRALARFGIHWDAIKQRRSA